MAIKQPELCPMAILFAIMLLFSSVAAEPKAGTSSIAQSTSVGALATVAGSENSTSSPPPAVSVQAVGLFTYAPLQFSVAACGFAKIVLLVRYLPVNSGNYVNVGFSNLENGYMYQPLSTQASFFYWSAYTDDETLMWVGSDINVEVGFQDDVGAATWMTRHNINKFSPIWYRRPIVIDCRNAIPFAYPQVQTIPRPNNIVTPPAVVPKQSVISSRLTLFRRVTFKNLCTKGVYIAINYQPILQSAWVSNGYFYVKRGASAYVAATQATYMYYYAESEDGLSVWEGTGLDAVNRCIPGNPGFPFDVECTERSMRALYLPATNFNDFTITLRGCL